MREVEEEQRVGHRVPDNLHRLVSDDSKSGAQHFMSPDYFRECSFKTRHIKLPCQSAPPKQCCTRSRWSPSAVKTTNAFARMKAWGCPRVSCG